ncbi:MAG: class I SAM-dependent methyltransferase [Rhodospirillales bacterium]|nr:class I SAM-dependent methyltransferase [Rhodospirillales bacterium]MDH3910525.1 class I SAM-dependent methyltransferase [Rhodospirillales bacterium]MDH3920011.1 class I SAM-dependent methyltransferase [Rhodospirillales bacterium]MDH3966607.1 class I SAM-dependent methyltransferase [Rhodospirillales bacterium]
MSRLDSFIRRLEAQRACLEQAVALVRNLSGPICELGLGNGRTYDHLRQLCPDRQIFVFERQVAAHPDCVPDPAHLLLGDIHETLPRAVARFGRSVPMVHSDMGTGDAASNAGLAAFISGQLSRLLMAGGVVISDQALALAGAEALDLPAGVSPGRYFLYRMG